MDRDSGIIVVLKMLFGVNNASMTFHLNHGIWRAKSISKHRKYTKDQSVIFIVSNFDKGDEEEISATVTKPANRKVMGIKTCHSPMTIVIGCEITSLLTLMNQLEGHRICFSSPAAFFRGEGESETWESVWRCYYSAVGRTNYVKCLIVLLGEAFLCLDEGNGWPAVWQLCFCLSAHEFLIAVD